MNTRFEFDRDTFERVRGSAHTLVAGTTGSGKSVLLNELLVLLHSQTDSHCIFYDLKRVELIPFKKLDFCLDYITEPEDVVSSLDWAINLMEKRYQTMKGKTFKGVQIYLVVDELADMVTIRGVLERLVKIGRLGRAAGIHMLCATQDPSRRTLHAQLMQNFTCTIALRCRSSIESRQIIGVPGAELLPKHGEAYIWDADGARRIKIPYMSEDWLEEYINLQRPVKELDLDRIKPIPTLPSTWDRLKEVGKALLT